MQTKSRGWLMQKAKAHGIFGLPLDRLSAVRYNRDVTRRKDTLDYMKIKSGTAKGVKIKK